MNETRQSPRSLSDDRRGAVMVVGVFMAAFLVGALWYIIGFGDAILYRQRMQDGADAVAYAAAVYHARGMNIIAMINIIMAAILAVLVALKICQMLLIITNVISCAICALPYCAGCWACPICVASSNAQQPLQKVIDAVQKFVDATLPILSKTQVGIAYGMPWIAQARAVATSKDYSKPVEGGVFISSSLVPSGGRLGLAVQEDEYKELCRRAGMVAGELALKPFSIFGVSTQWASGLVGDFVSTFPGYFCGDSGGSSGSSGGGFGGYDPGDKASSTAKTICDAKQDAMKKKKKKFDYDDCIKEETKKAKKQYGQSNPGQSSSGNGKTPKRVYDKAANGNDYFQIWSVVWGDQKGTKAEDGVKIAAWNKAKPKPPEAWTKMGFAQAEYYYDGSGSWGDLKEDAMWNMRWRARLRRVRPPSQLAGALDIVGAIAGAAGALGMGDPSSILSGSFMGGGGWADMFSGGSWDGMLQKQIGNGQPLGGQSLPAGYTPVGGFQSVEIIH